MTDRIKENIFNILGAKFGTPGYLPDCAVLDMFAGTGGLGIEALSRGAAYCTFVEQHRITLKTLRANLEKLKRPELWSIHAENAWTMRVPKLEGADGYSLVFLDPPYRDADDAIRVGDLLERVVARLTPDGVIMLRVERGTTIPESASGSFQLSDERSYGRMRLAFFERTDATDGLSVTVRPETADDREAIHAVHFAAFPAEAEAQLVGRLRETDAFVADFSLAAVAKDQIVGHLLLTKASIRTATGTEAVLALAPMAVLPKYQRKGIGTLLVRAALEQARAQQHELIVVIGHPAYYPRFGFVPAGAFGIRAPFAVPDEAFLCCWLKDGAARRLDGKLEYAAPFNVFA